MTISLDCGALEKSVNEVKTILNNPALKTFLSRNDVTEIVENLDQAVAFCKTAPRKMRYAAGSDALADCDEGNVACWGVFENQGEAAK